MSGGGKCRNSFNQCKADYFCPDFETTSTVDCVPCAEITPAHKGCNCVNSVISQNCKSCVNQVCASCLDGFNFNATKNICLKKQILLIGLIVLHCNLTSLVEVQQQVSQLVLLDNGCY
ncbi:Cysteine-rich protein [Spironucleus salmonicida]|uniref:Cysteine-rich protein n=1 Tax=Spironucleus salmonicida TaxID=348837 RepID=V6LL59_9EUKA|nr:Cysteine-rich protein [Spironucleus salmonicida]|eukprot:EST44476.1 Cysteine-rich protein [Spironucleus salmonicida]